MTADVLAWAHAERIRRHAPLEEYNEYLDRWIDDPVYRRMLRHYRDQLVLLYPDIEAWFAAPLFERVGHEWWNAGPPRSRRTLCHSARSYLHYLGLRGYVWFDWDWVLTIARHRIWELDERLGLTIHRDSEALVSEAVRLGYCAATARQTLQWTLSRLLLHRGDPRVDAITEHDLDDLTEAVQRFGERSARSPCTWLKNTDQSSS
jgi:hypothetical protein